MSGKNFALAAVLILICGAAWMALPMSVMSEKMPILTGVLKVLGSVCGIYGIFILYKGFKNQGQ